MGAKYIKSSIYGTQSDFFRECHRTPSQVADAVVLERLRMLGYVE